MSAINAEVTYHCQRISGERGCPCGFRSIVCRNRRRLCYGHWRTGLFSLVLQGSSSSSEADAEREVHLPSSGRSRFGTTSCAGWLNIRECCYHRLLVNAAWLLDDWPDRLISICRFRKVLCCGTWSNRHSGIGGWLGSHCTIPTGL